MPQKKWQKPLLVIKCTAEYDCYNAVIVCVSLNDARRALNAWQENFPSGVSGTRSIKYDGKELSWNGRYYDGFLIDEPKWEGEVKGVKRYAC